MKTDNIKQMEFGKLQTGGRFFLSNPVGQPDNASYTKINTIKIENTKWVNAKNFYGLTTFIQYDKKVWIK